MDSNALRLSSSHALSLTTIAGKPAPTRDHAYAENEVTSKPVKAQKKSRRERQQKVKARIG
jgi:hypothetical protein